ncbi:MAG: fasciclin domain-containing protein [Roseovarius sp.]
MKAIVYSALLFLTICLQSTAAQAQTTVGQLLSNDDRLLIFSALVDATNQSSKLNTPGNYTIFAFTNAAFRSLPKTKQAEVLQASPSEARRIVGYHIHNKATLTVNRIPNGSTHIKTMLRNQSVCVRKTNTKVFLTDGVGRRATVIAKNKRADNGVVHVIDLVMEPGTSRVCR